MTYARVMTFLGKASLLGALLIGVISGIHASLNADESLYHRLGGREMLRPMVNDFVDMVMSDSKIRVNSLAKKYLDRSDSADIKGRLMDILCEATGGPCKAPTARASIRSAIVSVDLTPADWVELENDFSASMGKFKVSSSEQAELRALFEQARQNSQ
jgi:hemoglobin